MSLQPDEPTLGSRHQHMLSPSPRRRQGARSSWDRSTLSLVALLVLLLVALAISLGWLARSTWVMPGVWCIGVPLVGKSPSKASAALQQAWQERTVLLQAEDAVWATYVSELGLSLNVDATVDAAFRDGRSWSHLLNLLRGAEALHIEPVVAMDADIGERYLASLAPSLAVQPVDAGLRIIDGRAEAVPPANGRALDVQATAAELAAYPSGPVVSGRLFLVFAPVPPTVADVRPFVEQVNAWLAQPLSVRVYDPISDESLWWTPPPEVWGAWLSLSVDPNRPDVLNWAVDRTQVRAYLSARAEELPPEQYLDLDEAAGAIEADLSLQDWNVSVRVYHHPGQHVVEFGETLASIARDHGFPYPWLQKANPGVDALRPGQVIVVPSPDVLLPLPIVAGKRIVVSISEQQMWAYEWDELRWAWTVSTGIASSPTSPGVFQVQYHEQNAYAANWDLWMPYFIGIYRPVPDVDFMNGFHGFPTRDGANLLWTGSLGHPVTYGCILVSTQNASMLYEWAEAGVIVEIRP